MDTLTFNSTEAPYARALQNQAMICGELDQLTPAAFQTELRNCLVDYYEKVCLMVGAGGALSTKPHKRKFKAPTTTSEVVDEGVEEAAGAGAGDIKAAAASMSPSSERALATPAPAPAAEAAAAGAAAEAAAAAEATPSPAKAAGKRGAGKSAKTR